MAEHLQREEASHLRRLPSPVIGEYVDRTRTCTVPDDVKNPLVCGTFASGEKAGRGAEALIEALARTLYQGLRLPALKPALGQGA